MNETDLKSTLKNKTTPNNRQKETDKVRIRGTEYRILVPRVYRIPSVHARMHAPRRAHAPRRNPEFRISDVSNIAPLLRVFRRFVGTAHQGTKYLPRAPKVSPRPTETDNQTRTAAGERERLTSIEMRPIYGSS